MRKNWFFLTNKFIKHPPPPLGIFYTKILFLNVGNGIKRKENMKYSNTNILKITFSIFQKFIKNSNNIPSISKTIQQ